MDPVSKCPYCELFYPTAENKLSMNLEKHMEWCKTQHPEKLLEEIFGDTKPEE